MASANAIVKWKRIQLHKRDVNVQDLNETASEVNTYYKQDNFIVVV